MPASASASIAGAGDVTGDGERFGVAGEPFFGAEGGGLQRAQVVEVLGFARPGRRPRGAG